MLVSHIYEEYSSTRGVIALSPWEAEYYGLTKVSSVLFGIKGMCEDTGISPMGDVKT